MNKFTSLLAVVFLFQLASDSAFHYRYSSTEVFGECQNKTSSACIGGDRNFSPVRSDDGFYNCQAYTAAFPFTLAGGINAIKTIEKERQMFRRDWRTGVFNNNMYLVVRFFYPKSNGFTRRRIAHRIRE